MYVLDLNHLLKQFCRDSNLRVKTMFESVKYEVLIQWGQKCLGWVILGWKQANHQKGLFNMYPRCIVDGDFLLPNEIDSWNFQHIHTSFLISWSLSKFELI
jgi:hypothetical protein